MTRSGRHSYLRILKFLFGRALSLMFAVVMSVWLTIAVASKSGVLESELSGSKISGWFPGVSQTGRQQNAEIVPYRGTFPETLDLILKGLTLDLGESTAMYLYSSNDLKTDIASLILDFLSRTLLLFGIANILLLVVSITLALWLYRHFGGFFDRLMVTLSPLSSVPAWLYGLVLAVIAAQALQFYPNGIFDNWPTEWNWNSVVYVSRQLLLPVTAIFLSKVFQSVYLWRTFFLIHANEDYVEMGVAKGLKNDVLDRRYVIRPALPSLLTNFAIMVTSIWQEAIVIELFFGVAGIGHLFYNAMRYSKNEMPLLIGLTVTFAYLLAFSVFLLDILYALFDPRVRLDKREEAFRVKRKISLRDWLRARVDSRKNEASLFPPRKASRAPLQLEYFPPPPRGSFIGKIRRSLISVRPIVVEFRRYPLAVLGLIIILLMAATSIYTVIAYPYQQTVAQWRNEGNIWGNMPKSAAPAWTNWFRFQKLAESQIIRTENGTASKVIGETVNGMTPVLIEFVLDYAYDDFPSELILRVFTQGNKKGVFVSPTWIMPDGREIRISNFSSRSSRDEYRLFPEENPQKATAHPRRITWFSVEHSEPPVLLKGTYILRLEATMFEPGADIDAEVLLHGQLYGVAGTDSHRRDLLLPLLWGMPIALIFGLVGALLASLTTITLAAIGVWFGGWVDALIQRLTEINMVLPAFPLLVLMYITLGKNVWMILGLAILLNMTNNSIKNYRAAFIQIKEAPYIEAAQAYGASDWRIILLYLLPRILPLLVPQLVSLAPGLVFLEATLAYLNISDPTLPTWGKLIQEAISSGALNGAYYQVLEPVGLLLLTGLALSMMGFALDRILNPKLREI